MILQIYQSVRLRIQAGDMLVWIEWDPPDRWTMPDYVGLILLQHCPPGSVILDPRRQPLQDCQVHWKQGPTIVGPDPAFLLRQIGREIRIAVRHGAVSRMLALTDLQRILEPPNTTPLAKTLLQDVRAMQDRSGA